MFSFAIQSLLYDGWELVWEEDVDNDVAYTTGCIKYDLSSSLEEISGDRVCWTLLAFFDDCEDEDAILSYIVISPDNDFQFQINKLSVFKSHFYKYITVCFFNHNLEKILPASAEKKIDLPCPSQLSLSLTSTSQSTDILLLTKGSVFFAKSETPRYVRKEKEKKQNRAKKLVDVSSKIRKKLILMDIVAASHLQRQNKYYKHLQQHEEYKKNIEDYQCRIILSGPELVVMHDFMLQFEMLELSKIRWRLIEDFIEKKLNAVWGETYKDDEITFEMRSEVYMLLSQNIDLVFSLEKFRGIAENRRKDIENTILFHWKACAFPPFFRCHLENALKDEYAIFLASLIDNVEKSLQFLSVCEHKKSEVILKCPNSGYHDLFFYHIDFFLNTIIDLLVEKKFLNSNEGLKVLDKFKHTFFGVLAGVKVSLIKRTGWSLSSADKFAITDHVYVNKQFCDHVLERTSNDHFRHSYFNLATKHFSFLKDIRLSDYFSYLFFHH